MKISVEQMCIYVILRGEKEITGRDTFHSANLCITKTTDMDGPGIETGPRR